MNEIAPISVSQAVLSDTLNRIALLQSSGLQDESRILCQWVIDQDPENACAHHFLAIAHLHAHELGDAVDSLDRALALEPENPHFLHLYAVCLNVVGEYDKAVEVACAALAGDRARYDSWTLLADSLLKLGKLSESEKAVRQAIEIDPRREEAFMGLSRLAAEYGSHTRAEAILDHAIALCATPPMHLRVRRLSAALAADNIAYIEEHLETALKDAREEADVLELLRVKAWTLFYVDRADEAIALLEGAVSERPDPGLMSLLSLFLSETERVHDAIAIYERMLEAHPDEHGTRFNLSLSQLTVGRIGEGLDNYEARWRAPAVMGAQRSFMQPQWEGEDVAGKRLLLWGEQGLGDQIRHASVLHEIRDLGAQVTLECHPKLLDLFRASFPWAHVRALGPLDCVEAEGYDDFDLHSPMGSITRFFRRDIADFRARTRPFMVRDRAREKAFADSFRASPDEILIGICWRSGTLTSRRQMSYLTIGCFERLAAIPRVRLVALQYDMLPLEIEESERMGLPLVVPPVNQKDDLVAARHVIGACDLVISATTSVTDIAGAMGKPLLIFGRKLSWTRMGEADNPWYVNNRYLALDPDNPPAIVDEIAADWDAIRAMIERDRRAV